MLPLSRHPRVCDSASKLDALQTLRESRPGSLLSWLLILCCVLLISASTGARSNYFPLAAQWDNLAITKAASFLPPQASGNLRPLVSLTSPANGATVLLETIPAILTLTASATDRDGSIAKVEFYAGATKLGQGTASPYTLQWTNPSSGACQLTAVATDNQGATTVSAPIAVNIFTSPQPVALTIVPTGTNLQVSWPASATASFLQGASNSLTPATWQLLSAAPALSNSDWYLQLADQAGKMLRRDIPLQPQIPITP